MAVPVHDHAKALKKYLEIAKESIQSGDLSRAQEFLDKARKLNPSITPEAFFSNLMRASQPKNNHASPHSPRRRIPVSKPSPSTTYTVDQVNVVREIMKNKKDYYKILGLKKNSSTEDAHTAYRKLSLKVHPDKNSAPGAEEAFKMLSKAFQCLSNDESRKLYDHHTGSEEHVYERTSGGSSGFRSGNGNRGLFGYDVMWYEYVTWTFLFLMWVGLLSFIICTTTWVVFGIKSAMEVKPRIYSFSMSDSYNYSFTTQNGVAFYVQSAATFEQQHPPNSPKRVAIERNITRDYHRHLYYSCHREMSISHVDWGNRRESPKCDALKGFESVL